MVESRLLHYPSSKNGGKPNEFKFKFRSPLRLYIQTIHVQRVSEESEGNLIPDEIRVKIKDVPLKEREIQTESHDRKTQERDSDYKPTEEGRVLFIKQKSRKLTKIIR